MNHSWKTGGYLKQPRQQFSFEENIGVTYKGRTSRTNATPTCFSPWRLALSKDSEMTLFYDNIMLENIPMHSCSNLYSQTLEYPVRHMPSPKYDGDPRCWEPIR